MEKPDYQLDEDAYGLWAKASGLDKERASEALYPVLLRYARSILWRRLDWRERHAVYELADQAVALAMTSKTYLGQSKFTTWFFSVVDNLAKRWLDREKRHLRQQVDAEIGEMSAPDNPLDAKIMVDQLRARLEPADQEVFDFKLQGTQYSPEDGEASRTFCEERHWRYIDSSNNELENRWKQLKKRIREQHLAAS